jgi:hypothetical protein
MQGQGEGRGKGRGDIEGEKPQGVSRSGVGLRGFESHPPHFSVQLPGHIESDPQEAHFFPGFGRWDAKCKH